MRQRKALVSSQALIEKAIENAKNNIISTQNRNDIEHDSDKVDNIDNFTV